mmetsp:Transcript_11953/g.18370  ORF Transcript_11953/g.18370 Transcript_11953/m.18370 type:complete len:336 (-) Transcript_11953:89-1096(-)
MQVCLHLLADLAGEENVASLGLSWLGIFFIYLVLSWLLGLFKGGHSQPGALVLIFLALLFALLLEHVLFFRGQATPNFPSSFDYILAPIVAAGFHMKISPNFFSDLVGENDVTCLRLFGTIISLWFLFYDHCRISQLRLHSHSSALIFVAPPLVQCFRIPDFLFLRSHSAPDFANPFDNILASVVAVGLDVQTGLDSLPHFTREYDVASLRLLGLISFTLWPWVAILVRLFLLGFFPRRLLVLCGNCFRLPKCAVNWVLTVLLLMMILWGAMSSIGSVLLSLVKQLLFLLREVLQVVLVLLMVLIALDGHLRAIFLLIIGLVIAHGHSLTKGTLT